MPAAQRDDGIWTYVRSRIARWVDRILSYGIGGALMQLRAEASSFDAEVHDLVTSGESSRAVERLLSRLSSELRPFLHRLLGAVALADEAHDATCEQLSRGLTSFRWECSLRSWSYIVARREAKRCRDRFGRRVSPGETLVSAGSSSDSAREASASSSSDDTIDRLRASLSDDDRDLLVLRIERGLVWREIAAAFLEEHEASPDAIERESTRLRVRFRAIRDKVAAALAPRPSMMGASREA